MVYAIGNLFHCIDKSSQAFINISPILVDPNYKHSFDCLIGMYHLCVLSRRMVNNVSPAEWAPEARLPAAEGRPCGRFAWAPLIIATILFNNPWEIKSKINTLEIISDRCVPPIFKNKIFHLRAIRAITFVNLCKCQ